MKKFLILVAISAFAMTALAQTPIVNQQGITIYYRLSENSSYRATVVKSAETPYSGAIVIPESVRHNGKTYDVFAIDDEAFKGCGGLYEITIPKKVSSIGGHAFKGCSSLRVVNYNATNCQSAAKRKDNMLYSAFEDCTSIQQVNFGNDVVNIPGYLFWGCTGISEITIPENVKHIAGAAFIDCTSLTTLNFNAAKCLSMCSHDGSKTIPAFVGAPISDIHFGMLVTTIPDYAFFGNKTITSITIPESIEMIGGAAFRECPNLTSVIFNAAHCTVAHSVDGQSIVPSFNNPAIAHVQFGDQVTTIPDYMFWGCSGISDIILPQNLESIGVSSFFGCTSLRSVTIPESVERIGGRAFSNCHNLNTIYFNAINCVNLTSYENEKPIPAFTNPAITSIVFGSEVRRIPDNAFAECSALRAITIPETVEYIGVRAFAGCKSIETVTIPANVTSIGGSAFSGCIGMHTVNFNARQCTGVTKIEEGKHISAFSKCNSIKTVTFGSDVEIIPDYIFAECGSIERITIPAKVRTIGSNSFLKCTGLRNLEYNATRCEILVSDSSTQSAFGNRILTNLTIGENVKVIPPHAFSGCQRLENVSLPAGLETIGKYAFSGCPAIKKIAIPENTKVIGAGAFENCMNLKTLNYNAIDCQTIGSFEGDTYYSAFAGTNIATVVLGSQVKNVPQYTFAKCHTIQSVKLNKALKTIGKFAFSGIRSLSTIELPENLETIAGGAFADCENLQQVTYNSLLCTSAVTIEADTILYPFMGKNKIENIVLGKKVTSIPEGLFYNSQRLEELYIPKNITAIGGMAFGYCPELGSLTFDAIKCESASSEINGKMRSAFEGSDALYEVTFGSKVEIIADYLFQDCRGLTRVAIPKKVTRIGRYSFAECENLARITIPINVTAISEGAFHSTALTTISIHEEVSEIGEGAFDNCKKLSSIRLKKKNQHFVLINGKLFTSDESTQIAAPTR